MKGQVRKKICTTRAKSRSSATVVPLVTLLSTEGCDPLLVLAILLPRQPFMRQSKVAHFRSIPMAIQQSQPCTNAHKVLMAPQQILLSGDLPYPEPPAEANASRPVGLRSVDLLHSWVVGR